MRRIVILLAAILLILASASPVAAKSPYRIYLEQGPFDFPASLCGFVVHADVLANREYASVDELSDGTVVLTVRGSMMLRLSNPSTGESITVNAGGPGTIRMFPDGTSSADMTGRSLMYASNLTSYGLPSNLVATAGPSHSAMAAGETSFSRLSGHFRVLTDVCAALAP